MKKKKMYQELDEAGLQLKEKEFVKDLVSSRLSMDMSSLTSASNVQNLLRELKIVKRLTAIQKKVKKLEVNQ